MNAALNRRRFLSVTGQGVAAVGIVGAAGATFAEAPVPAEERARRAWAQFSEAMREITAEADGWRIVGAGETQQGAYLHLRSVHLETSDLPGRPGRTMPIEQHRQIDLLNQHPT